MEGPGAATTAGRLAFLDVVRAVAAFSVAFEHRGEETISGFRTAEADVFSPGEFGVVLFFLCSGFIIPASLERYGSLKRFWISRFFRLFPLYWFVLAAALVFAAAGIYELTAAFRADELRGTLANLTMLQAFLDEPLVLGLTWTLAFEMAFYLIVSGLFVVGVHRRSVALATILISAAAAAVIHASDLPLALAAVAVAPAAVAALSLVRGLPLTRVALLAGVAALATPLLLSGGYFVAWQALVMYAAMFTGTVMYRWVHGELDGAIAAAVFAGSGVVAVGGAALVGGETSLAASYAAVYVVFALALTLRRVAFPPALVRLGVISYSLYLIHPLVYAAIGAGAGSGLAVDLLSLVAGLALSVAVAEVTYRLIEKPMIARGHAVSGRRTPLAVKPELARQPA